MRRSAKLGMAFSLTTCGEGRRVQERSLGSPGVRRYVQYRAGSVSLAEGW